MSDFSSQAHAAVAALVAQRTGLAVSARVADTEAAMRRAMIAADCGDTEQLLQRLRSDAAAFDALIDEITVGETYFFREPAHFELVRRVVIPALRDGRGGNRPIRVWSAGCSSGEEPYSLAILFEQEGLADRVRILATDISRRALEAASVGRYRPWALRGLDARTTATYFEQQEGTFVLHERIRRRIELRRMNLGDGDDSSAAGAVGEMDLILCRNVLIYLDPTTVERVSRRLRETLAPDGWLITASTDPPLHEDLGLSTEMGSGYVCYRRGPHQARSSSTKIPILAELPSRPPSGSTVVAPALAAHRHQRAIVLADRGADGEAVVELERAICIDPSFVAPHFVLGALLARSGDRGRALRAYRTALDLCAALAHDAIVPFAEGETAGALRDAARREIARLEALDAAERAR